MSSVSESLGPVQQPINLPRVIPQLQLSSDTDTTRNIKEHGQYYSETTSETASTLSSSITTTSPSSTNTELESISSLELSPPEVRIEIIDNVENTIPDYLEGNDGGLETISESGFELEGSESDDSAMEYQDVDIYTDEASDGGSLQWDERASISDTDAVYSFEEADEEF